MPDAFLAISEATFANLDVPVTSMLPDIAAFESFCRDMYQHIADQGTETLDLASRSTEFHMFGVTGAPGGSTLAPMLWSISQLPTFFAQLINAQTALVMNGPVSLINMTAVVPTIYTANTSSQGIMNEVIDTSSITNVTTLSWSTIRESMPTVDLAVATMTYLADPDVLTGVVSAVRPGGIMLLTNASNGGELYNTMSDSFAQEVHDDIHASGNFSSFHLQGYLSYSVFLKHS